MGLLKPLLVQVVFCLSVAFQPEGLQPVAFQLEAFRPEGFRWPRP